MVPHCRLLLQIFLLRNNGHKQSQCLQAGSREALACHLPSAKDHCGSHYGMLVFPPSKSSNKQLLAVLQVPRLRCILYWIKGPIIPKDAEDCTIPLTTTKKIATPYEVAGIQTIKTTIAHRRVLSPADSVKEGGGDKVINMSPFRSVPYSLRLPRPVTL
jgi:hypothetical protein